MYGNKRPSTEVSKIVAIVWKASDMTRNGHTRLLGDLCPRSQLAWMEATLFCKWMKCYLSSSFLILCLYAFIPVVSKQLSAYYLEHNRT
jgi:hypothetical protein